MIVTQSVIKAIASEGATHVFLVPGGIVDPLCDALAHSEDLLPVVAAHEGGALYMADGYARASGRFGAAICIGGPGVTNTVTGMYTAYMDQSPVLLLSGEVRTEWEGRGFIQDTSPNGPVHDGAVMRNITALTRSLSSTTNLGFHLRAAFKRLLARSSAALCIWRCLWTFKQATPITCMSPPLRHCYNPVSLISRRASGP